MKGSPMRVILAGLFATTFILAACSGGAATTSVNTTTTPGVPAAPSAEELAAQDFVYPELPRITCEQLKQMMDNGEPLLVVDTNLSFIFKSRHLPEAINIPYLPKADQITSFLTVLPTDIPIIFYCA